MDETGGWAEHVSVATQLLCSLAQIACHRVGFLLGALVIGGGMDQAGKLAVRRVAVLGAEADFARVEALVVVASGGLYRIVLRVVSLHDHAAVSGLGAPARSPGYLHQQLQSSLGGAEV